MDIMCIHDGFTHKMLSESSGIKSGALGKQLAGLLFSQVCGHDKELSIQSRLPRLPNWKRPQRNQTSQSKVHVTMIMIL